VNGESFNKVTSPAGRIHIGRATTTPSIFKNICIVLPFYQVNISISILTRAVGDRAELTVGNWEVVGPVLPKPQGLRLRQPTESKPCAQCKFERTFSFFLLMQATGRWSCKWQHNKFPFRGHGIPPETALSDVPPTVFKKTKQNHLPVLTNKSKHVFLQTQNSTE
jgi:hypothetical protein